MEIEEELPPSISKSIACFDAALVNIENVLNPFFKHDLRELKSKLTPLDGAKLNIAIAYATYTLFYMYLKTQGVSPATHPVTAEMQRVKHYLQKIKALTEPPQVPKTKINVDASRRIILAGTGIRSQQEQQNSDSPPKKRKESEPDDNNRPSKKQKSNTTTSTLTSTSTKQQNEDENNIDQQEKGNNTETQTQTQPTVDTTQKGQKARSVKKDSKKKRKSDKRKSDKKKKTSKQS
eukprot:TRINITY_DN8042_c0_g1_i1.p1 TRINITY_DN8042_c0_g1~~TRINITY_DN8042_c0_g1_i1.p1  ORF type:complete len:235 (+),score=72.67 TRINITY_DN8042_c0_g1_i1:103-807(+)